MTVEQASEKVRSLSSNLRGITILLYIMSALMIATLWFSFQSVVDESARALEQAQVNEQILQLLNDQQVQFQAQSEVFRENTTATLDAIACILLVPSAERSQIAIDQCIDENPLPPGIGD